MKRNIAIVVPNLAGTGGERVAIDQAQMFYENGNNVVLFLLENEISYKTDDFDFSIVSLTNKKDKYKLFGKFGYKLYAKILEKKMKQFGSFDLVLSNLPRADRTVKELKHHNKHFIIHISIEAELNKFKKRRKEKKYRLYKYLYSNEKIVTVSKGIIQDFEKLNIKYKSAVAIHNGFDFDEVRNKGDERIDLDFEYIISPSAFREQKRYDIVLDSFKKIRNKDIKLVILCKQDEKLQKMIKERKLEASVIILGFQKNPFKYIKNARLTILASDYEGFGMVIVESLILGTPVVSTNCPIGPAEILNKNLSKWLVPMNDSDGMAKKLDEALETKIIIEENQIQRFSKESIYKEYEKLCQN